MNDQLHTQETSDSHDHHQTIFIPGSPLTFDSQGKLLLYACREDVRKLKRMTFAPLPFLLYFGYCLGHNIFIAHSILKSILWLGPFMFTYGFRRNLVQNCTSLIDTIHLLECGTKVEIKNVYGVRKGYLVKHLRKPTPTELNQFKMAGGQASVQIMADYFPVLVDTGGTIGRFGFPSDIIFIDRNGEKYEPEIVNAVLNGVEIDTQTHHEGQGSA